jgi:O-antigen ligase
MLPTYFRSFRHPAEFALLCALILFIPLFEVPKNILLGLYAIAFVSNRYVRRGGHDPGDHGGHWDVWDSLFALWIASAYVVAAFSGLQKNEWQAIFDVWKYVCLAWMLKRSGYGEREWRAIYVAAAASTLLATLWGIAALAVPHKYAGIELHSVGHVNHSAAYIAITIGAALAGLVSFWPQLSLRNRVLGLGALLVFGIAIVLAGSRAATVVSLAIVVLIGAVWSRRSKAVLLAMAITLVVFVASIQTFDKDMHRKNELAKASPHSMLNERYPLWHQALAAWRANPWFGVGMDNFDEIDQQTVKGWVEHSGEAWDPSLYAGSSHAHSLYLTTLAERGVFGFAVLMSVLLAWAIALLRSLPRSSDPPLRWMLWGGAASALVTTVAVGFVNTTLHHEHGLLAMLLLGCWLGEERLRRTPAAQSIPAGAAAPATLDRTSIGD